MKIFIYAFKGLGYIQSKDLRLGTWFRINKSLHKHFPVNIASQKILNDISLQIVDTSTKILSCLYIGNDMI